MDSLSNLAVSTLAQIGRVTSTTESLQNERLSLARILDECERTRSTVLQIQNLVLKDEDLVIEEAYSRAVIEEHAAVLRTCSSTFITINEQLAKLETDEEKSKRSSLFGKKLRSLFGPSQDVQIETIFHSVQSQTIAIGLLLHELQAEVTAQASGRTQDEKAASLVDISRLVKSGGKWPFTDAISSVEISTTSTLGEPKTKWTKSDAYLELQGLRAIPVMQFSTAQRAYYNDQAESSAELALIEVDLTSMTSLTQKLRSLVSLTGLPATSPGIRIDLESLIDNSNHLFDSSPFLLQMSIRASICQSTTIEYGARRGSTFLRLANNELIKDGITSIAVYFTYFAKDDSTPFRLRLLHLIILLLSMVNDVDVQEISGLLESIFNLKADRGYLELLFLKFIPLVADTPKGFLQAVAFALEGHRLTGIADLESNSGQSHYWETCILQILDKGFLLPGSAPDLGRDKFSWMTKWPDGGYMSSQIFRNLQPTSIGPRTLVDLAFDELHIERTLYWRGVIMTNVIEYGIQATDYDQIKSMVPGRYLVQEACGSHAYLIIEERDVNSDILKAIRKINKSIAGLRKTPLIERLPPDCQWSGKLQQISAQIDKHVLALNFKLNRKDVYRIDASRAMSQDIREASEIIDQILRQLADNKVPLTEIHLSLREAIADLMLARQAREKVVGADNFKLNSNPISEVLQEPSISSPSIKRHWSEYKAWFEGVNTRLHIEAFRSVVSNVAWLSSHKARVSLYGFETEYVVTTLAPFNESASTYSELDDTPATLEGTPAYEAVHEGYSAILAGQYLIMADRLDKGKGDSGEFRMRNYLRVVKTEIPNAYYGDERSLEIKGHKVLSIFR